MLNLYLTHLTELVKTKLLKILTLNTASSTVPLEFALCAL